ncbi:MAG: UDP-N-acetylmuramoyl-L-alanine--D-glutamate ligase [Bacteroidota bacterium]|nr:UDP-N-acetylmuramoyl-L-alanine--D-glutamate ligase [Bacteroidota bacterium]
MTKQRVVILGAGESGVGSAVLAQKKGFDVFVSDFGAIKENYREALNHYMIPFEEGKHTEELILNADLIIKSPGIAEKVPIIKKLHEKNIPVISEIEFAGRYNKAKTICITGSNGKTTTTLLIYHILKTAGLNVGLAGNVGKSFAWQVAEEDFDYYVIELSSFQLDGMYDFRVDVAVIMNITPDHLDRYQYKMENYVDSKFRIIRNQRPEDYFIFCADDPVLKEEVAHRIITAKKLPFSLEPINGEGACINQNEVNFNVNNNTVGMSILDLALKGKHNAYNSMAAGISAMVLDIRKDNIRECLSDFQGVEHRLENFLQVHGIEFINDSKATNVNSTWYALESMVKPVIWIVGGIDKGNDYSELLELVKQKVKGIICLGVDNAKIHSAFDGVVTNIVDTDNMTDAVKLSYEMANEGDVVLLSPACASFDLFENYEDRGRRFKQAVRNL